MSPAGAMEAGCKDVFVERVRQTLKLWTLEKWDEALARSADGRGPAGYAVFTNPIGRRRFIEENSNERWKWNTPMERWLLENFDRLDFGAPERVPTPVKVTVEGGDQSGLGTLFTLRTRGVEMLADEARHGGRRRPPEKVHDNPVPTQFIRFEGEFYWVPWGW